jgi:2-methylisocitrate lyase-like PEP mutase family enzyme
MTSSAETFRRLHAGSEPLLLVNAWDRTSARVLELAGAPAIGTTSAGTALSLGYPDGEQAPWEDVLDVIEEMAAAIDVPLSVDVEAGRGGGPDDVAATVGDVLQRGAVGINLEDIVPGEKRLFDVESQRDRIAASRAEADRQGVALFLNARCDVFFGVSVDGDPLDAALARARAYVEAGADGIFLPGLLDLNLLRTVCSSLDVPINALVGPGSPPPQAFATVGVRRLSQGAWPFAAHVEHLHQLVDAYLSRGAYDGGVEPVWSRLRHLVREPRR